MSVCVCVCVCERERERERGKVCVSKSTQPLSLSLSPRADNLQQAKARLEVTNSTLKAQHQKELEGREEEVETVKTSMNKKLKALGDQIEELHEEKQAAVKVGTACSAHTHCLPVPGLGQTVCVCVNEYTHILDVATYNVGTHTHAHTHTHSLSLSTLKTQGQHLITTFKCLIVREGERERERGREGGREGVQGLCLLFQARRDLERELAQYQGKTGDPEVEKKLKKQIHKYKALLQVCVCVCGCRWVDGWVMVCMCEGEGEGGHV